MGKQAKTNEELVGKEVRMNRGYSIYYVIPFK